MESLDSIKADHKKFNSWVTRKMKEWINTKLASLLFKQNLENFKELEELCNFFGKTLIEYEKHCANGGSQHKSYQTQKKPEKDYTCVDKLFEQINAFSLSSDQW